MATGVQVVFDCADPARMAKFWSEALHYAEQDPPAGFDSWQAWLKAQGIPESEWNSANAVVDPAGTGPRIYFQRVPEGKSVKNRVHLDLNVGGGRTTPLDERKRRVNAEAERLIALGAKRAKSQEGGGEFCLNMYDPEGNEFDLQ
jgi:hypothetical protein